jgi:hypothetical protein
MPTSGLRGMSTAGRLVSNKPVLAITLTVAYAALTLAIYLAHARWFPVGVVFYSALLDAVLAAAIMAAILWLFARRTFTGLEKVLLVAVWLLGGYAFAVTGPTVLDRSLSFYILEKLQQRGGGIREDAIGDVFVTEYMPEFRLIDVRLTEQVESGTVVIVDGCVKLTPHGERLASLSRFIRTHFLPKHRLLAGEYTDALVDPFANSPEGPMGYECR